MNGIMKAIERARGQRTAQASDGTPQRKQTCRMIYLDAAILTSYCHGCPAWRIACSVQGPSVHRNLSFVEKTELLKRKRHLVNSQIMQDQSFFYLIRSRQVKALHS